MAQLPEGMLPPTEMARLGWPHQSWVSPGLRPAQLNGDEIAKLSFVHHMTRSVSTSSTMPAKAYGNTLWVACTADSQCVALTFDWALLDGGIIVLADPCRVASNLWPVDESGAPLPESGRFITLNTIVWALRWQHVVLEVIAADGLASRSDLTGVAA